GLSLKAAERLCVVGELVGKELQGDVATELEVFSLIHHTHPATADLAEYSVMGNRLPHGLGRRGHRQIMVGSDGGQVNESDGLHEFREVYFCTSDVPGTSGTDAG